MSLFVSYSGLLRIIEANTFKKRLHLLAHNLQYLLTPLYM